MSNHVTSPNEHASEQRRFQELHNSFTSNMNSFGPSKKVVHFIKDNIVNYNTNLRMRANSNAEYKDRLTNSLQKIETINTLLTDKKIEYAVKENMKKEIEEIHDRLNTIWENIRTDESKDIYQQDSDNYIEHRDKEVVDFLSKRGSKKESPTFKTKKELIEVFNARTVDA